MRLDVTDAIVPGESNILAVRLENEPQSSRWYPGAGLYRNVHLVTTDELHFKGWGPFFTTPEVSASKAKVSVQAELEGFARQNAICRTAILDKDGFTVASVESPVKAASFSQELIIDTPNLWSPKSPYLYKTVTQIYVDGRMTDEYAHAIGIRKIEFIDGVGFLLNGELTKFKGVSMHHDLGPLGAAVNKAAMRHQIQMLQDMGCNAIRTAHNPPAPEYVELCDEMGMMMMIEAFDEWKSAKLENGYHCDFDQWAEKDLVSIIHQYRNHPSVFLWSTGNEICRVKEDLNEGLAE